MINMYWYYIKNYDILTTVKNNFNIEERGGNRPWE